MEAAAEVARRKVNRAAGLLRDAQAELAALVADDVEMVGIVRVHDADSLQDACDLAAHGRVRHGIVDVVVIARPRKHTHHGPNGAKENGHAASTEKAVVAR